MWHRFNTQFVKWVNSAWKRMTWTSLPADTELGRRSRLLTAALLIILAIGATGEVDYLIASWKQLDLSFVVTTAAFIFMLLAYALNRRGRFQTAAGITIGTITIAIYSLFWLSRDEPFSSGILLYLLLPILLSNFVLPWRWYMAVVVWILAGIFGFLDLPGVRDVLYYLVVSAALMGIFNMYHQMLEDSRLAAVIESETRYHHILDSMMEGCQIIDFDWRYVFVNEVVAGQGRRRADELLGHTMMEMYPGIENTEMFAALRRCMEERTPARMENQFTFPDGSIGWFELSIQPAREGVFILSTDITERKRAEHSQRRHLRELQALNVVSSALRTAQTMEEALPILLDQTLLALGCEAGEIVLYEPGDHKLHVAQARGWFDRPDPISVNVGEGVTGTVFASGQALQIVEFAKDPRLHPEFASQIPAGWGGACVPIRSERETVGVFTVSTRLPNQVSSEDMNLLQSLAEMAGAMFHRMRLHEQTTRRLMRLQILQTVDQAITSSLDLRLILEVLFEEILSQLGVDAVGVLLLNPDAAALECAAGKGFRSRAYQDFSVRVGEGYAGRCVLEREAVSVHHLAQRPEFGRARLVTEEGIECYHAAPLITKGQVLGVLELFMRAHRELDQEWYDFFDTLSTQAAIAIDNARLFENLQHSNMSLHLAYDATIEGWSRAMDLRDKETEGHTQRVTDLTIKLARDMGVSDNELVHIRRGALLHDMGKMGVPDTILLKPGKLTEEEWTIMRQHPVFAYEMLQPIEFLRPALDIPYCHHEKWDGSGYPRGLTSQAIPLSARIFAVVDVWDALTSDRPYRKRWSKQQAMDYIRDNAGGHFDPHIVELFMRMNEGRAE